MLNARPGKIDPSKYHKLRENLAAKECDWKYYYPTLVPGRFFTCALNFLILSPGLSGERGKILLLLWE
jgi:hypothetical protein